ncbi:SGNH/GDSL hydrolase family protein [Prauserella rugosa]|uniref:GDSL-like lipase/acylhydrolase family protein n=1 Tax=Prauserella rugosa TaxID=43354 RepID=A0A660C941_9PSEU|nr:hypothetical protein ACZ91_59570 [Streptomyces regensis]TWH20130.1 GDSL-like lipase/acylhydrolase family protein [Prauserella rugosa]
MLGAFGAALALTLTLTPAASASMWKPSMWKPRFEHYVALGDSYTSGPLIPVPKLTPPLGCVRSMLNYPTLLAVKARAGSFDDVSCGGAETSHMTAPQHTPLGTNAPQLDALRPDTDLVTLGIGGNDESVFGGIVGTCPGLRDLDPTGAPCREHFTGDGADELLAAVERTGDRVEAVLREIGTRSPEARVLVVGYPRITPDPGVGTTCPKVLPFADGDLEWAHGVETALADALREAVHRANAAHGPGPEMSFVDMHPASEGHDACSADGAWIQGRITNPLVAMSYHPNAAGMRGVAAELHRVLS